MIRVQLPAHLRTLAGVDGELGFEIAGRATQGGLLDAIEARYPMLRGTMRDQVTRRRRLRFRWSKTSREIKIEKIQDYRPGGRRIDWLGPDQWFVRSNCRQNATRAIGTKAGPGGQPDRQ